MKKLLLVLAMVFLGSIGYGQDLKIGVRTGLNYYKLLGELETNETQSLSAGFHFAITGKYKLTENFAVRTELVYIQKSSLQEYTNNFVTVFNVPSADGATVIRAVEEGGGKYSLKRTFNIFSIPLHAVYKPTKKFEFFGGLDIDFTAGVIGQGRIEFDNGGTVAEDNNISYNQTLNFNYSTDQAGQSNVANNDVITIDYDFDNDGERDKILIPKSVSAYLYNESDEGKAYSTFDLALAGGVSYYINPGLYVRATGNYGLLDSSKSAFDHSLQEINLDGSYIFRDDRDNKIGFQVSIGFEF